MHGHDPHRSRPYPPSVAPTTCHVAVAFEDLSGVRFFSSAGLTLLVQLDQERRQRSVDVRLVGDQCVVVRPLELTGLREVFPIHTTLADALAPRR